MQDQNEGQKTVDVTPTWEATVEMLCVVMRDGSYDGFCAARAEMRKLAQWVDRMQKQLKEEPR